MARSDEQVRFVIEIEVHDVARFKEVAAACVAVSRDEPGTLVYDWYLDEEAGRARLYEAYESLDALAAHTTGPVFTEVGPPLLEVSTFVHVDAFGIDDPGEPSLWPTTFWGQAFTSVNDPRRG